MNQEPFSPNLAWALSASGGRPVIPPENSRDPEADDGFRKLLLAISAKASGRVDHATLIQFFCHATREFFQVSGVYFWRCAAGRDLVGEQADGKMAERFSGTRLSADQSAVTAEAVRQRRTIFTNHLTSAGFSAAAQFEARSLLAAPLLVFNEVIGAITFLHDSEDNFFNPELASQATVLAGQLSALLEATRLGEASREDHRRAEALATVAHAVHAAPDVSSVIEALADRLRLLLGTRLVCVLLRREGPFELSAVSAETPQMANSARSRHDRQTLRFVADLAQRAVAAGEPVTLSIGADLHSLGDLISPGMLIAAPFRTSRTQGAILLYPRTEGIFTAEEKAMVATITGFGAVAVAHAELHATSHAQAQERQQLLEISSELASAGNLDHFLQTFVLRAADFLGFGRCFIALEQQGHFQVLQGLEGGQHRRVDLPFPEGVATRALRAGEVFWTDEASKTPGVNIDVVTKYKVRQILAVPLIGAKSRVLGMFGVLDRLDNTGISQEDVRRAKALASQAALLLEVTHKFHIAELQRRRSEVLMELASQLNGLRLPEFARRFVGRIVELTGSRAGFLAVVHEGHWQLAALLSPAETSGQLSTALAVASPATSPSPVEERQQADPSGDSTIPSYANSAPEVADQRFSYGLERPLSAALADFVAKNPQPVISAATERMLGPEVAANLGWSDPVWSNPSQSNPSQSNPGQSNAVGSNPALSQSTLVRLSDANGEPVGLLCLSGRPSPLGKEDSEFLQSMAGPATIALENARLFTRIEQANRQWVEIFDAITDFIVVHDQNDRVLRVNRSLAAMIGVPPSEVVGVNMCAVMALTSDSASYSCPFCRGMADDSDEFSHPVFDRIYLVSTSRVQAPADEGPQVIHVLKDISDRREAERRYRELFDNIQEGLFFSTPGGRFIEVNDAMVRMLGYNSREELLQIDIPTELYFLPEQRDHHSKMMEGNGHLRNFEATLRRKDGSPLHVLINAFGLHDAQGGLLQIRGLMLDVTGLRTFQSELHRERDFSGKILSNTQSLILVADTSGLISYANRRWQDAGFQQPELVGRPLVELASTGYVRALAEALHSTLHGQQVDNLELQIVRGNGSAGTFSANLSPMRNEEGTVSSIVLVLTDITDSSVLRDKLVHAEKMAAVGQLVSGVAHEVNNPLTAILGFTDLLMENPELPETARKDLRVILQEAQRTKQIVQNLLSFARQMPPQRSSLQLNTILRRTIQLRSYDFNSHGVDIVQHLDEDLPEVMGDAHQLQQVFLNIVNNAYDAVHEVGRPARIEIMSTKAGDAVEVSFRDNGNGISHADKIFDPFFTTKEIGKGTGLGLSICYGILKEHGGEILCHNNTSGQGATFIVRLPTASRTTSLGAAAGVTPGISRLISEFPGVKPQ